MYRFLNKNNYIEKSIQKGFVTGMTGTFEHTAHLAQMIKQAKLKQRSIVARGGALECNLTGRCPFFKSLHNPFRKKISILIPCFGIFR